MAREDFLPVFSGFRSPKDRELKLRPGLVVHLDDNIVDFIPIVSIKGQDPHAVPSWGIGLGGNSCTEARLFKASCLSNEVFRVGRNSVWAREMHAIGKIFPQRDKHFAENLVRHIMACQCIILTDQELPVCHVQGSDIAPIVHLTYKTMPYMKLVS